MDFGTPAVGRALETALSLQAGLKAWTAADPEVELSRLKKAFRDNWDSRVGKVKFGGVWSVPTARKNSCHPASKAALRILRDEWSGSEVTVDHAIPVNVLFGLFRKAQTDREMQEVIDAYAVAVVTREENDRLGTAKLGMSMPEEWRLGDDPLARWHEVGIEVELICPHGLVHVEC